MEPDGKSSGDTSGVGDVHSTPKRVRVCTVCNSPLTTDTSGEFCPICMLRNGLGGGTRSEDEGFDLFASSFLGQEFGQYKLAISQDGTPLELGRGAMGITYKAFDIELRCPVALKVIGEKYLDDEAARRRFLREARAAASLRHPNVASVFHLGRSNGNYFYAMEFVEGETLERLIQSSGHLDIGLAMDIAAQVAFGLAALHKKNLVHRDVKPANIMVSLEEQGVRMVKIIDLGLAKVLHESVDETVISMPGVFAGTPEFASPEQCRGRDVDIRSDLYSFGITLWDMLAGRVPYRGTPLEVMYQHQHGALPIDQLNDVPQPVIVLLEILLEKNPFHRFQSPSEFLEILPSVKDAIASERRMMKTVRVNVSSSGDVQKERHLAERLIRAIAADFYLPVSNSELSLQRLVETNLVLRKGTDADQEAQNNFILCLCFWQSEEVGEAEVLGRAAEFDLIICIAWSRLGPVPESTLKLLSRIPDRQEEIAEVDPALAVAFGNWVEPRLIVYRNCSNPTPPLEPREEREKFCSQWDTMQEFFATWEEKGAGDRAQSAYSYRSLEQFEDLFRRNFRRFLVSRFGENVGHTVSRRQVRRWKSSPFRGLNVFGFEHSPIFHGRTKATGEVLEALGCQFAAEHPFVMVVGASGSGKSSLVQAGVLPLLTEPGTIEGIDLWRRAVTRPGAGGSGDCFDALASALLESAGLPALRDPESINGTQDLARELREHPDSVALRVRDSLDHAAREWKIEHRHQLEQQERHLRASGRLGEAESMQQRGGRIQLPKARLALVVDQLEELFTSGFSPEVRQNYVSTIAGLVRSGRVFVLATLRSDFYPLYQQFPELVELTKPSGKIDLRPPTPYEIGEMIRLPAESAGLHFEAELPGGQRLDEALRDAAAATPESLPLLEHVLSSLYDAQAIRGDELLRWSDYREFGELTGALAKHAEKVFGALRPQEQDAFPLVMRYLVTLGQGEEEVPNRRTVPYRDFADSGEYDHAQKAGAEAFVNLFVEKRLFVADIDPQGQVTVSVAHEALLKEWQRVKEWLIENREFLRMRDRLDSSLQLWLSRGKQKDDLLGPGLPLAEAEKLDRDFGPSLSREEIEYVEASIAERKRRKRIQERVRYAVMSGITAALVAAVIFAAASFRQYRRAERAKVVADKAAKRATLARSEAEKLINFMTIALRDKLKPIGRLDLLNEVNQRVQDYYQSLGGSDDSPEIQRQHGIALVNYGDVLLDQGAPEGALKLYQSALEIRRKLRNANEKNPLFQADLALSLQQIGNVFAVRDEVGKALENYQEARDILEQLIKSSPQNTERQAQLVRCLEKLGLILKATGDLPSALKNYRESLEVAKKLSEQNPKDTKLRSQIWILNVRVGEALDTGKDPDGALNYYRDSLTVARGLAAQEPDNTEWQRDVAVSDEQIGEILSTQGDLKGSLEHFTSSFSVRRRLSGRDPTNALWEDDLALSYEDLGGILKAQGDLDGALKMYRDTLSHRNTLAKRDQTNANAQHNLEIAYAEIGSVLLARGDFQTAWESCSEGLKIANQLASKDQTNTDWQSDLAEVSEGVGDVLKAQAKFPEALAMYRNAVSVRTKFISQDVRWQTDAARNEEEIADVLIAEGDFSQASDLCRNAIRRGELLLARDPNDTNIQKISALTYEKLGETLVGQAKPDEALQNFRISLRMFDTLLNRHPAHAEWESAMAFTYLQIAHTLKLTPPISNAEIHSNLNQAQDILLRKRQRFALGVIDDACSKAVEEALRDY